MSTRKIKDGKVDGEKVFFKGHAKATFMSDGRTVEDAINQVGTGGGGGGITTETDPIFSASPAAKITDDNISAWNGKQDKLADLEAIRSGAAKGATALQVEQYKGTVTSVKINGETKTPDANGVVDLGTIEGGGSSSGGSSAYPRIDYMWTAGSETISPNTFHVWGSVTWLSIEFGEEISGVANEYLFQFTCDLYDESVITLPDTIVWANGEPTFDSGCTYQISVLNGIGLVVENEIIIG